MLTNTEKIILGLGGKFLPTYMPSKQLMLNEWKISIDKFEKLLINKMYFHTDDHEEEYDQTESNFFIQSLPKGPTILPRREKKYNFIHEYVNKINHTILNIINNRHIKSNPSDKLIIETLKNLHNDKSIVIKPSDKNLGLVIMNTSDYIVMCNEHLHDTSTYKKITSPYDLVRKHTWAQLKLILNTHGMLRINNNNNHNYKKTINDNKYTKLASTLLQLEDNVQLRIGPFYALPKMHKKNNTQIPGKPIVPGRPIISSPSTMTYHTSIFLHNLLHPLLRHMHTICTSSSTVLKECKTLPTLPRNAVILTADVKALYPSIPIEAGVNAVQHMLQKFGYLLRYKDLIINLLRWVLKNNYTIFNNEIYLQIQGTAMGTPLAPTYAQIFLYAIEFNNLVNPIYFRRYIDDIFAIYADIESAKQFLINFQQPHPTIILESIHYERSGIFLDLEFYIDHSNKLQYKIYQKPMNKYSYIPMESSHNINIFYNFVTEELRRYGRSCSLYADFVTTSNLFKSRLEQRGYSYIIFASAYARVHTEIINTYMNLETIIHPSTQLTSFIQPTILNETQEETQSPLLNTYLSSFRRTPSAQLTSSTNNQQVYGPMPLSTHLTAAQLYGFRKKYFKRPFLAVRLPEFVPPVRLKTVVQDTEFRQSAEFQKCLDMKEIIISNINGPNLLSLVQSSTFKS